MCGKQTVAPIPISLCHWRAGDKVFRIYKPRKKGGVWEGVLRFGSISHYFTLRFLAMNSVNSTDSVCPDHNWWLISLPALLQESFVVFFSPLLWRALCGFGKHWCPESVKPPQLVIPSQGSLEQVNEIIGGAKLLERSGACCTVFHWLITSWACSKVAGWMAGFFSFCPIISWYARVWS